MTTAIDPIRPGSGPAPRTSDYALARGTHATPEDGRCAMEWVSHLAGEPHSDAPACVSPVLRALCVALNDALPDGPRQRLRPPLARTIGTAGDGLDAHRAWLALDWLTRTYAPAWLHLAGLDGPARALAARSAVLDERAPAAILPALRRARAAARCARIAEATAGAGPLAARWGAIRGAREARSGRESAWAGGGAAAWAAVRTAVTDPAADEARAVIRAIAGDAAALAVRRVADDEVCGVRTIGDAHRAALGATWDAVAVSALELLERMLVTEVLAVPAAAPELLRAR